MKLDDLKHMIRKELVKSLKGAIHKNATVKERTVTFPSGPWKPKRTMTDQQIKDRDAIGKEMLASPSIVAKVKELYGEGDWESYLWGIASATAIDDDEAAQDRTLAKMAKAAKNRALNAKGDKPSFQKAKEKKAQARAGKLSAEPSEPKGPDQMQKSEPEKQAMPDKEPEKQPEPQKSSPDVSKKKRPPMKISGKKMKKAVVKKKLTKKKVDPKMKAKAKKISKVRKITGKKKQKAETVILTSETQA